MTTSSQTRGAGAAHSADPGQGASQLSEYCNIAHRARSRKLVISELYYWFYRHVIPFYYRLTVGYKMQEESAQKVASLMKRKHPKMSQIHGQIDPGEELVTKK